MRCSSRLVHLGASRDCALWTSRPPPSRRGHPPRLHATATPVPLAALLLLSAHSIAALDLRPRRKADDAERADLSRSRDSPVRREAQRPLRRGVVLSDRRPFVDHGEGGRTPSQLEAGARGARMPSSQQLPADYPLLFRILESMDREALREGGGPARRRHAERQNQFWARWFDSKAEPEVSVEEEAWDSLPMVPSREQPGADS
ncbi:hypothetical protein AB1Y20_005029 [Prymnesium parvum]|uniref:Uncharacterized protein n=1 Tax=Prymnesium parvum TaxID=97485 RepID=A0AB34J3H5_PRYPA